MPSENINWGEANDPTLSDWTDVDFRGRSATDDFWEFVFHSSTALVPADHFNGWLKWFAWLCPSMAPKIRINPSFVQYNGITKHGELIHRSIFISDPTSEVSLSDIYHLHGITYESLEIIL